MVMTEPWVALAVVYCGLSLQANEMLNSNYVFLSSQSLLCIYKPRKAERINFQEAVVYMCIMHLWYVASYLSDVCVRERKREAERDGFYVSMPYFPITPDSKQAIGLHFLW